MSIEDYEDKRDFDSTAEPESGKKPSGTTEGKDLVFVVQKHYASHLHYDLRLELDGVLKSWAVPKGPSLDPSEKHLAVMVEDHPYDYKDFSGIIPEGNYGAGKVEIWDEGTYHSLNTEDREGSQEELRAGLKKGHVTIIMDGKKLNGEFALIKLKDVKGNNWLLIKKNDDYAVRGWKIDHDKNPGDIEKTNR
jgi:bifunctional non-homologous end joining protein LigD